MSSPSESDPERRSQNPGVTGFITLLEHAQDVVTVCVGTLLIALAMALLVSGIVDFFTSVGAHSSVDSAAINLLDRVLLVLILVEIVHTVVLSLRAHSLVAQPFIVVGLVAVIRRILFVLSSALTISTAQFALLIAMTVVFIGGLIVVRRFDRHVD